MTDPHESVCDSTSETPTGAASLHCRFEGPWPDPFLAAIMGTGLGIGVVVGLLVRTPRELLDMVDGPLGATLGVGLAVWAAMDKWQAELSGTGTCGLKAVARVVGLFTPMVAVGASIALAGHTLSLTQGGLVAAALGILCVLLVVVQTWSLLTSSGRNS